MRARLPLSALLSQALVAFTIELDNEFEHRMPHRTTRDRGGAASGPWLGSLVLWSNCMQYLDPDGVTASELGRLARAGTNLAGMRRWGGTSTGPAGGGAVDRGHSRGGGRSEDPGPDWVIRPTRAGQKAQDVWRPLPAEIEARWRGRFGEGEVGRMRSSLADVVGRFERDLPEKLPILGHGLFSTVGETGARCSATAQLPMPALLSQALLGFALPFEQRGDLSLAISANIVRVLGEEAVRPADITRLAGVSIESVRMALEVKCQSGSTSR